MLVEWFKYRNIVSHYLEARSSGSRCHRAMPSPQVQRDALGSACPPPTIGQLLGLWQHHSSPPRRSPWVPVHISVPKLPLCRRTSHLLCKDLFPNKVTSPGPTGEDFHIGICGDTIQPMTLREEQTVYRYRCRCRHIDIYRYFRVCAYPYIFPISHILHFFL